MDAHLGLILENLKNIVIFFRDDLNSDVQRELSQLDIELNRMKTFLTEMSNGHVITEQLFKYWEKEIREVIYQVEDTVDTYIVTRATTSWPQRAWKRLKSSDLSINEKVKSLMEKLVKPVFDSAKRELANLPVAIDASQTSSEQQSRDLRKKDPRQDNVVGFEDEANTIIGYLKEDSDNLEVVSIVGMPGLGKTTVAWKIKQDCRIKYEFPTLIWIYVTQEFNIKDVLLTILKKFVKRDMSRTSVEELARKVKKHLEVGKFLIFMDDVWSVEAWNKIREFLPMTNKLGKVLITSRDENVAQHANTTRKPHKLRFLTKEESWQLLQLEVCGKPKAMHVSLEKVGQQIANQCNGLPLSIIVIGGILIDKLSTPGGLFATKREWEKVSESVQPILLHDDVEKRLENIISLSYTRLPYGLRDCFLYLGMFPEDPEIPAWKLTRLWIAEGFIQKKPERSLEEVAQENLKDLINRNLVMVGKSKDDGEVKTCRVHDTIREFCKNEGRYERQNLFQEIRMSKQGVFEPPPQSIERYRRLCIHSYVNPFFRLKPIVSQARSFLCFSKEPIDLQNADISNIIDAFTLLRVFDATLKFQKYPAKITNLIHLRYLTLSAKDFSVLPDSITKFWNLQTLIIDTSSRTLDIKADLWQMMQLRHLKTKASINILIHHGNGAGGQNFQTLGKLSPHSCREDVFSKAKNLNTLAVRGDLNTLPKSECFENLNLLNKLKLVHDAFPHNASDDPLTSLPQPNRFPLNLRTLVLSGTYLKWHQISSVGQLQTLEVLKLKDNAFTGISWKVSAGGFCKLEFLYIERTNLKHWEASAGAIPGLRSLVLKNCEKLESVPFELKDNLEVLSLERVTPYAVASAKKIEEAKQQMPGMESALKGGFKLLTAPGDQLPNC